MQVSKSWKGKLTYTLYWDRKSQNPEIRENPENFHLCIYEGSSKNLKWYQSNGADTKLW